MLFICCVDWRAGVEGEGSKRGEEGRDQMRKGRDNGRGDL